MKHTQGVKQAGKSGVYDDVAALGHPGPGRQRRQTSPEIKFDPLSVCVCDNPNTYPYFILTRLIHPSHTHRFIHLRVAAHTGYLYILISHFSRYFLQECECEFGV